jgi:hypothetical protein
MVPAPAGFMTESTAMNTEGTEAHRGTMSWGTQT